MKKRGQWLQQYLSTARAAWRDRHLEKTKPYQSDEREFLPPAVALLASPPAAIARHTAWVLAVMVILVLLWSILGKTDVIAIAPGKLIPSARSKTVQSPQIARVKAIYAQEGMAVKKGQLLIELDPTVAAADKRKIQHALRDALLRIARGNALLTALKHPRLPEMLIPDALNTEENQPDIRYAQQLLRSQWQEYQAKMTLLETDVLRKRAEYEAAHAQVAKLTQMLPIVTQRAQAYLRLSNENFVARHHYLEKEQVRIETVHDLASQRNRCKELKAAVQMQINQQTVHKALFAKEQHDQLQQAQAQYGQLQQEYIKTNQQYSHTQLIAPIDGVVQGLVVHTVGGVITPAQVVMHIVPGDDVLEVEAWVSNKDIGFIKPGQRVAIKIETFQYIRYGLLEGVIRHVSTDAVPDEKRGLIYAIYIRLPRPYMWVEGKKVGVAPGMAVEVDIKTGKRRLIEYFLSPFIAHANESLRER